MQRTKRDYGRFVIEWLGEAPPTQWVSKEREQQIVEVINFLLPKLHKYGDFIRREWIESRTLLAMDIYWPPGTPEIEFDFWYDQTDSFGLHIMEWADDNPIGSVIFPQDIWL